MNSKLTSQDDLMGKTDESEIDKILEQSVRIPKKNSNKILKPKKIQKKIRNLRAFDFFQLLKKNMFSRFGFY